MDRREELEMRLAEFPLVEYGFLKSSEVAFLERVRSVCREHCPQYGKSWACPPAVGTVAQCQERCWKYKELLVFSTVAEVSDITDIEEALATREGHEEITRQVGAVIRELYGDCQLLSTESCAVCENCTYPATPCRHPERLIPCVESYGILVTDLAEKAGMTFFEDYNTVVWFSVAFFNAAVS